MLHDLTDFLIPALAMRSRERKGRANYVVTGLAKAQVHDSFGAGISIVYLDTKRVANYYM